MKMMTKGCDFTRVFFAANISWNLQLQLRENSARHKLIHFYTTVKFSKINTRAIPRIFLFSTRSESVTFTQFFKVACDPISASYKTIQPWFNSIHTYTHIVILITMSFAVGGWEIDDRVYISGAIVVTRGGDGAVSKDVRLRVDALGI